MDINKILCEEFKLKQFQIDNTIELIDADNTIPFIARYRKELTGSLDDQILREIHDRLLYLRGLEKRKGEIHAAITEQEKMTDEINKAIEAAKTLAEVEDIYRPFKPKRKTRASVAREKGLEPLSAYIMAQSPENDDPNTAAALYLNEENGVTTIEDAIKGALDIIAEDIADNANIRKSLRIMIGNHGEITAKPCKNVEIEDTVYNMYAEYAEPLKKIVGHRVLALDRAEREGILNVSVVPDPVVCLKRIEEKFVKNPLSNCGALVKEAAKDSFDRLLFPSLEREIRTTLTENAAEQAIKVFAVNLKQLLMQPPIKNKVTIGLDPGFRTGCKVAVIDGSGKVLDSGVIYPTHSKEQVAKSEKILADFVHKYGAAVISIGNGTASRETEKFVSDLIKSRNLPCEYAIVNEAGASVYSASKLASEEFPQFDVTIRGAISIARRLQDPLAELVKIDPKAIGVGEYQHDMPKNRLDAALEGVVENCVNTVGVDLNTASYSLLAHIAGVNSGVAKNIVKYREENGIFNSRKQLMDVPKLGKKAFLQCAGFLRVPESENFLDNTGVHPESYDNVEKLFEKFEIKTETSAHSEIIEKITTHMTNENIEEIANEIKVGRETLEDIIKELQKPGRDPRDELPKPILRNDVLELKDLTKGMVLMGTVRNVVDFGAFVDIGVHEDGLVHISQICNRFIKHPSEALKVGDIVKVMVLDCDLKRSRISLTIRGVKENTEKSES